MPSLFDPKIINVPAYMVDEVKTALAKAGLDLYLAGDLYKIRYIPAFIMRRSNASDLSNLSAEEAAE